MGPEPEGAAVRSAERWATALGAVDILLATPVTCLWGADAMFDVASAPGPRLAGFAGVLTLCASSLGLLVAAVALHGDAGARRITGCYWGVGSAVLTLTALGALAYSDLAAGQSAGAAPAHDYLGVTVLLAGVPLALHALLWILHGRHLR